MWAPDMRRPFRFSVYMCIPNRVRLHLFCHPYIGLGLFRAIPALLPLARNGDIPDYVRRAFLNEVIHCALRKHYIETSDGKDLRSLR